MNKVNDSVKEADAVLVHPSNQGEAARLLSETMIMAGYLPDGDPDEGMPDAHQHIESRFRNLLFYLKNSAN